jgi:uncharacterized protein with GYD domain
MKQHAEFAPAGAVRTITLSLPKPRNDRGAGNRRGNQPVGGTTMLFSITANYTPQAINTLMANPDANRAEAVTRLIEAAGGKLVSFYSTAAEGPGVLVIFDAPDLMAAAAIGGVALAGGAIHNYRLTRLLTPDEAKAARRKAAQLKSAYAPPS